MKKIDTPLKWLSFIVLPCSLAIGCAGKPMHDEYWESSASSSEQSQSGPMSFSLVKDSDSAGSQAPMQIPMTMSHDEQATPIALSSPNGQATDAEATRAIADAKLALRRADGVNGAWRDTEKHIDLAEKSLMAGDTNRAIVLADEAEDQANQGLNQVYLEQAKHIIRRVKEIGDPTNERLSALIGEAESAFLQHDGEKAYEIAGTLWAEVLATQQGQTAGQQMDSMDSMAVAPLVTQQNDSLASSAMSDSSQDVSSSLQIKVTPSTDMASAVRENAGTPFEENTIATFGDSQRSDSQYQYFQYQVSRGDSLWSISANADVYNNPYQWPLIYKTNVRQITDPDLIFPGQVLDIDRAVSATEVDEAISHAKSRGAWTIGIIEDIDKAYLTGSAIASR